MHAIFQFFRVLAVNLVLMSALAMVVFVRMKLPAVHMITISHVLAGQVCLQCLGIFINSI